MLGEVEDRRARLNYVLLWNTYETIMSELKLTTGVHASRGHVE